MPVMAKKTTETTVGVFQDTLRVGEGGNAASAGRYVAVVEGFE